jgi:hypothetical protein
MQCWALFAELEYPSIAMRECNFAIFKPSAVRGSMAIDTKIMNVSRACVTVAILLPCYKPLCHKTPLFCKETPNYVLSGTVPHKTPF